MFLRKLFKIGDKAKWLSMELLIVFIGVYLAFLLQGYNEGIKEDQEKAKVFSSLKYELENFRLLLPGRAGFASNLQQSLLARYRKNEFTDYGDWRFIEPQYEYQIVEYTIGLENTNIVDFQLYDKLQALHTVIKKLEHAERLLMQTAQRYQSMPEALPRNSNEYIARYGDNLLNFRRFITLMGDRASNLADVAEKSEACLEVINRLMDPKTRKEIETDLISRYARDFGSLEEVVPKIQKYFTGFTAEEIERLYNEPSSK